ncbi:hypothetical protein [Celeribacter sp.]|uniref:hypothetical protein n=1 Tax=Celeribacter sp. TaxID=1890673 RepID=UPI003A91DD0C
MEEFVLKWWTVFLGLGGIVAAGAGAWFASRLAQTRNTWRLELMEKRQREHEERTEKRFDLQGAELASLKADTSEVRLNFSVLQVTLDQMRGSLDEIKTALKEKQDK